MGCFPACFTCSASNSKRRKSIPSEENQAKAEENLLIKLIRESKEEVEVQVKCGARKRVTFDLSVKDYDEFGNIEDEKKSSKKEEEAQKITEPLCDTKALCIVSSSSSAPNNRYQDCRESIDECEDIGLEASDDDDESLFSLSIDSRRQACEVERGEKEVNSPMPVANDTSTGKKRRFLVCDSVLNPIENLTRRNEEEIVKDRPVVVVSQRLKGEEDKENMSVERPSLKWERKALDQQEIRVDTSLSGWLVVGAENSESDKENSPLCDLPKNEKTDVTTPAIGTVGSFWVHTGRE